MARHPFFSFTPSNRRTILLLTAGHLLWCGGVFGLWAAGGLLDSALPWWSGAFLTVQFFAAAQLLLPALRLYPEERSRGFYLFWGIVLVLGIWLLNRPSPTGIWRPLLTALQSGLLMLAATVTGAALARYVRRLWEVVPVCLVMTLADFASWLHGPTAGFTEMIEEYYRAPVGPPPLIDMALVKLAFPGPGGLAPVFGVSDWVMVVFFAVVARRHGVNDNLLGTSGGDPSGPGRLGRYLPVPVAALFGAIALAQATGLFLPALPLIALTIALWYGVRYLLVRFA